MTRSLHPENSPAAGGVVADGSSLSTAFADQPVQAGPRFRRPKVVIPVPTPSSKFQRVEEGVPDTQLTREATGLLREFSTHLLFNHSHRVFFWANELGRQMGQKFDVELLFVCTAFLLFNGVGLDVLGIGYETFPEDVRKGIVARFPRVHFKQGIAEAFLGGFAHKTPSTEGTCNEDICSHFLRNYKRSNFYEQIQNSPFQNS